MVDVTLLLGAQILLLSELGLDDFDVPLVRLVLTYSCLNYLLNFPDFTVLCTDLSFNGLTLLRNFDALLGTVIILNFEGMELLLETVQDYTLRVELGLEVLLQS